ncbi:endonuclease/exonuclease/phosphatase family protein [Virgibacillus oceani]|uniref:Metal-dependent hydrolase n=1 Tax=Virgibacillus oceani TaxID=1479511 RepID=A0A917H9K6_9BACI|nr:endonuclease/exonuclease/phosphatase family protein [Virgibacillus oceani]GGG72041.1 metal-dependent hydrolase [Virgibacillus oceani]
MKNQLFIVFSMLLMILLTPSIATADSFPDRHQDIKLNVMTFNIHAGIGSDGVYDINRTAETIRSSGADIVGLQEVDVNWGYRSNFDDQVQYLAEKLDMHAFFAPIYNQEPLNEGEPRRKYGLAVLSNYPIIKAKNYEITRLSTQDANPVPGPAPGFPGVLINVKGIHVPFYVTHLDYRGDPYIREMQVDDMLNIISEQKNAILVGDMNAAPDAPELKPLFERFQDVWTMAGKGDGYTYPETSPEKRIDYILTSPNSTISNTNVIDSIASDHLAVTTEVTLTRGK